MTKLEWPRQQTLIGGGHFVSHLGYQMLDKTRIQTWTKDWCKQFIYMKFGRNLIKSNVVRVTTTAAIDRWRPSWLSDVGQNPYSNLNKRLTKSNPYMKFGKNPIKNDWVRVTTTADIDRWRPFCRPSMLSDRQKTYSNLNESLMKAIYMWNLKEIG